MKKPIDKDYLKTAIINSLNVFGSKIRQDFHSNHILSRNTNLENIIYDLGVGYNYGNVYECYNKTNGITIPNVYTGVDSVGQNTKTKELYDDNWKYYTKIIATDSTNQSTSKYSLNNILTINSLTTTSNSVVKTLSIRPYNNNLTEYNNTIVPLYVQVKIGDIFVYNQTYNFILLSTGQVSNYLNIDISGYNILPTNISSNAITINVYFSNNSNRPDYKSITYYDGDVFQDNLESYKLWGNVKLTETFVDKIKSYGFKTIRIPVTWSIHVNRDGKIDSEWLTEIKRVVDLILSKDMYCIINMHHDTGEDGWLKANNSNSTQLINVFNSLWKQIFNVFNSQYSNTKLIVEGFNEILDTNKQWLPANVSSDNLKFVDTLNQDFVNLAREKGYKGWLCCNSYASASYDTLTPPIDTLNKTMLQVHIYRDYFTSDNWKLKLKTFANRYNDYIVLLGEYGWRGTASDGTTHTTAERTFWIKEAIEYCRELNNVIPIIWDDGGNNSDTYVPQNYGLINKRTGVCFSDYSIIVNSIINTWNSNICKSDLSNSYFETEDIIWSGSDFE